MMKDIKNYKGQYAITPNGEVWSYKSQKFLRKSTLKKMYFRVGLRDSKKGQKRNCFLLHRLVAEAFIANPENKLEVNHINSNGLDNRIENLEWVSRTENNQHAWTHGKKVFVKTNKFVESVKKNVLKASLARKYLKMKEVSNAT